MTNIDAIKQEIKESLERKLLQAYAEGDETFEQFVSGLSEEQKDLLPGLTNLLEAGGNPALVGKGPPAASSVMNSNPLRGSGGFAGFGGFPRIQPASKMSTPNATSAPVKGPTGSPSGPAAVNSQPRPDRPMNNITNIPGTPGSGGQTIDYRSRGQGPQGSPSGPATPSTKPVQASPISPVTPNAPVNAASTSGKALQQGSQAKPRTPAPVSKPTMRSGPTIGPERTASDETGVEKFAQPKLTAPTNPVAKETQSAKPSAPAPKPSGAVKPLQKQPVKPVQNRPKPAKAPMRPVKKAAKSSFRNTNTSSIGSHMSRSMGGLGEDTHLKESFESFLRNKFLKGE